MVERRHSKLRGRRLTRREAVLEQLALRGAFDGYLLRVAPRLDRVLIPLTRGWLSATGLNRVALVTTTGAKTGAPRDHPLVLIDDGHGFLATGAHFGRPDHPAWSYNLLVNPECELLFRGSRRRYRAELLAGEARAAAWAAALDFHPGFADYETNAAPREIRLFRLRPTS